MTIGALSLGHHGMIRTVLPLLVIAGASRVAHADERELALHAEAGPAVLLVEDAQDRGSSGTAPAGRLSIRGSYGLTDHLAIEADLGFVAAIGAEYADQMFAGRTGTLAQDERALRVTVGGTWRLGVRWIPTLTAHVGYQHRWIVGACIEENGSCVSDTIPTRSLNDLVVTAGLGLDYRINARWVVGLSAQVTHAFNLDGNAFESIEIPLAAGYYWYGP
jgi:hypothetical protein